MRRLRPRIVLGALALVIVAAVASVAVASVMSPSRVLLSGLRLGCENTADKPALLVKPSRCVVYDATMTNAKSVDLHKLHWSRWSTGGATATGIECGFRARCDNTKVHVTLSGLKRVRCANNHDYRVFTKLTAKSTFGTTKVGPNTCPNGEG